MAVKDEKKEENTNKVVKKNSARIDSFEILK